MTFYFAWVDHYTPFNHSLHCREDEEIFSLKITQKEGGAAYASLLVAVKEAFFHTKQAAHIAYFCKEKEKVIHLFSGKLIKVISPHTLNLVKLYFTALPLDAREKQEGLIQHLKTSAYFDQLFYEKKITVADVLDAQNDLPYWDPRTGSLSTSNLFEGRQSLHIDEHYDPRTLKVYRRGKPLKNIEVRLTAQWIQKAAGVLALGPSLNRTFPFGLINTLTGRAFAAKWARVEEKGLQGGYFILKCKLEPFSGGSYPKRSRPLKIRSFKEGAHKSKNIRLKWHWYRARLDLGWQYQQKREETLSFTLKHAYYPLNLEEDTRTLSITLKNIAEDVEAPVWQANYPYARGVDVVYAGETYRCREPHHSSFHFIEDFHRKLWQLSTSNQSPLGYLSRASYFISERGQKTVERAIEIAKAHLASSSRVLFIQFKTDLWSVAEITCDHSLSLNYPPLSKDPIKGKVYSYNLRVDGTTGRQEAIITLACSIGTGEEPLLSREPSSVYVEEGYGNEGYARKNSYFSSPSGILYADYHAQYPQEGVLYPETLNTKDFVEELSIENPGTLQDLCLKNRNFNTFEELEETLAQISTEVFIRLKDLISHKPLNHKIDLKILNPWSSPKQINFSS